MTDSKYHIFLTPHGWVILTPTGVGQRCESWHHAMGILRLVLQRSRVRLDLSHVPFNMDDIQFVSE